MSISSIVFGDGVLGLKEKLSVEMKEHGHEIIVGAIMTVLSIAIVVAATGDLNQALAGRHRG
jgi:hypothetical protein